MFLSPLEVKSYETVQQGFIKVTGFAIIIWTHLESRFWVMLGSFTANPDYWLTVLWLHSCSLWKITTQNIRALLRIWLLICGLWGCQRPPWDFILFQNLDSLLSLYSSSYISVLRTKGEAWLVPVLLLYTVSLGWLQTFSSNQHSCVS